MSYVVAITRYGSPLSTREVQSVFRADPSFTVEEAESSEGLVASWRASPTAASEIFVYSDGAIAVTTPSDAALLKMQQIAKTLNASVTGEEGEDLTDVELVPRSTAGGIAMGIVLLAAIIAGLFWIIA